MNNVKEVMQLVAKSHLEKNFDRCFFDCFMHDYEAYLKAEKYAAWVWIVKRNWTYFFNLENENGLQCAKRYFDYCYDSGAEYYFVTREVDIKQFTRKEAKKLVEDWND